MTIGGSIRRFNFKIYDRLFNKGLIINQIKDLKSIVENHILGREKSDIYLAKLLTHASLTTKFYTEYKNRSLNNFPIVNKSIYQEKFQDFISNIYEGKYLHIQRTSGSTGVPFSVPQNATKRNRVIAELKLFGQYTGYKSHEKLVHLKILEIKGKKTWLNSYMENIWCYDISSIANDNLEKIRRILKKSGEFALYSYASTYDSLVSYLESKGDSSNDFNIKAIISGGEALSEYTRERLIKMFGCSITSRYSNEEMGILGQDLDSDRSYYLNWGSYYFECIKLDSDEPANPGEIGRIVITDLFNFAYPMIRYDTGDLGKLEKSHKDTWPRLQEIYGKRRDVIYDTSGNAISPAVWSIHLWGLEGVKQFQFIQESKTKYIFKINGYDNPTIKEKVSILKNILGENANITIEFVDEIPVLSSYKRQYTVCNIKYKTGDA